MTKPTNKVCTMCGRDINLRNFYASHSKMHSADGRVPYCKSCLNDMVDEDDLENSIKNVLRHIDKPFLRSVWESSVQESDTSGRQLLGTYLKNIAMVQFRDLGWVDSDMEEEKIAEKKEEQAKKEVDDLLREENLSEEDIRELEDKWGYGFEPQELVYFQRKYDSLVGNYPQNTSLHREALMTYCMYKVRAEMATAEGDISAAKDWGGLAQKQGEIAKINLNKLDKSDLSQGMDSFSELVAMVEKEVDIIPILPQFIERPQDKIDLAIYSFINYERRLHGLPEVEYSDIYDFYQNDLREYLDNEGVSEDIKRHMKEIDIDTVKGKKKIIFYDVYAYIDELKVKNPTDSFIQDLDKWVEFVSWARWNVDLFFDLVTPEAGGITLDVDQRFVLRCLSRFKSAMCVFPRGFSKCIAGDSLLFTDEGIREIGEYFDYQDNDIETYTEHNIGVLNKYGEVEYSDKGVYSGYRDTKIVRTVNGYYIEGSNEHPLMVKSQDGKHNWKKLENIKVGDLITVSRNNDVWGSKVECISDYPINTGINPIPKEILESNRNTNKEYIKALYEEIGIEGVYGYAFICKSEKLSIQIQTIMLNFGIITHREKISQEVYSLTINKDTINDYNDSKSSKEYYYSEVESITDSKNHVYDIQMPETQSFVANGIVNHNTFLNLLYNFHSSMFYPNVRIALTAQTHENAIKLVQDKWKELARFYPILESEMTKEPSFATSGANVEFKSRGLLDTLVNNQSAKGARRRSITVEEYAQVDDYTFEDVIKPIPDIPRITAGKRGTINPYELNGQINFFTTSWFVGTSSYERNLTMVDNMVNLRGQIVLGSDWQLAAELGRGQSKSAILQRKEEMSPTFFATNYESRWVGVTDGALVSMNALMELRTLKKAEEKGDKDGEYYMGVDVARSEDAANNQCSVAVVRVIRSTNGRITKIQLVNIINIPSVLNFKVQAQEVMKIRNKYNVHAVVLDKNGLGEREIRPAW